MAVAIVLVPQETDRDAANRDAEREPQGVPAEDLLTTAPVEGATDQSEREARHHDQPGHAERDPERPRQSWLTDAQSDERRETDHQASPVEDDVERE